MFSIIEVGAAVF